MTKDNVSNRKFFAIVDKDKGKLEEMVNTVLRDYKMTSAGCTFRDGKFFAYLFVKENPEAD
jgi:hypothetical protein